MSTPGPRKFLPSNNQSNTLKPAWRVPGHSAQGSQSSSSLKQPPLSRFAKTPRFATSGGRVDDEIYVNFEGRRSSSSESKAQKATTAVPGSYDDLVDEDDEINVDARDLKARRLEHGEDDIDASELLPNAARNSSRLGDTIQDAEEEDFPQPTSKRLKTSSMSTRHHRAILISSSSSEDNDHLDINHTENEHKPKGPGDPFDLDSDLDDNFPSSPSHIRMSTSTIPRFKAPVATSSDLPSTKPIFKPPLPSQLPSNTTLLPDTFSPSRPRGKRDFIPGGYADTVRNWVLELGTSVAKLSSEQSKNVKITSIQHDVEGRCATVVDQEGREWLLVNQSQQSAASLNVGDCVEVGGGGTNWAIDVGAGGAWMKGTEGEVNVGRRVNVSVWWKVQR